MERARVATRHLARRAQQIAPSVLVVPAGTLVDVRRLALIVHPGGLPLRAHFDVCYLRAMETRAMVTPTPKRAAVNPPALRTNPLHVYIRTR